MRRSYFVVSPDGTIISTDDVAEHKDAIIAYAIKNKLDPKQGTRGWVKRGAISDNGIHLEYNSKDKRQLKELIESIAIDNDLDLDTLNLDLRAFDPDEDAESIDRAVIDEQDPYVPFKWDHAANTVYEWLYKDYDNSHIIDAIKRIGVYTYN